MSRPRLFIVSGPSGSGKGTLLSDLLKRHPDVFYSISATTRAPREGLEQDGVHYYFLTHEKFEQMIADDAFIEYKRYCGNIYGTPRKPVEDALKSGRSVILEIETQGMQDAYAQYPDAVTVFIAPPSLELLGQRLRGRKSEEEETVLRRLRQAEEELTHRGDYQYTVVNDDLTAAREELNRIYLSETADL
ncbi:MAG: guanylate kinase [Clostridia bacterium]|nr:guanylate kinase [Clostridia bacterium]